MITHTGSFETIRNPRVLIFWWAQKLWLRVILPPCVIIWENGSVFFLNRKLSIRHLHRNTGSGRRATRDKLTTFARSITIQHIFYELFIKRKVVYITK